jgi:hypothetical protein
MPLNVEADGLEVIKLDRCIFHVLTDMKIHRNGSLWPLGERISVLCMRQKQYEEKEGSAEAGTVN